MDIKNNDEQIESLKGEIISLFKDLLQEPNGRYAPGSGYRIILNPDSFHYCTVAEQLLERAIKLSSLGYSISPQNLGSILNHEIASVRFYKYQYDKNGNPTEKSKSELSGLMNNANNQIRLDLFEILKDV